MSLTEKQNKELEKIFDKMGKESSSGIMKVAKKLHPDAVLIIPLYRSCLVILPKESPNHPQQIIAYHDPQWAGDKITKQRLPFYRQDYVFTGHRDELNIYQTYHADFGKIIYDVNKKRLEDEKWDEFQLNLHSYWINYDSSRVYWGRIMTNVKQEEKDSIEWEKTHIKSDGSINFELIDKEIAESKKEKKEK
jgi:hypothetical protein